MVEILGGIIIRGPLHTKNSAINDKILEGDIEEVNYSDKIDLLVESGNENNPELLQKHSEKNLIIPISKYNGNLHAIYKAWSNHINSFVSPDHKILLPILALQEILFKNYTGDIYLKNNRIVKIVSVGEDGVVSIEADSPYDIMPKEEEWIEAGDWKHQHDNWVRHPVAVKDHQEWFARGGTKELQDKNAYMFLVRRIKDKTLLAERNNLFVEVSSIVPMRHLSSIKNIVLHSEQFEGNTRVVGRYSGRSQQMDLYAGLNKVSMLVHEIGHAFVKRMQFSDLYVDKINALWWYCKENNSGFVSEYAKKTANEFFAESYFAYMMMPEMLQSRNNLMYEIINNMVTDE